MMKKNIFRSLFFSLALLFLCTLFLNPALAQDEEVIDETITIDEFLEEEFTQELLDEMFEDGQIQEDFEILLEEEFYDEGTIKDEYFQYEDESIGYYDELPPNSSPENVFEVFGVMLFSIIIWFGMMLCFILPFYIYYSFANYTIGKKLDVENGWMAWIPILNLYYEVKLARLDGYMFLLYFIPFVNIFIQIYAWMKIAERRGFESWLGILMIVPFVNFFIPGYIAWGEPSKNDNSANTKQKGNAEKTKTKEVTKS